MSLRSRPAFYALPHALFLLFLFTSAVQILAETDPHTSQNHKRLEVLIPDSSEEEPWEKESLQFEDLDLLNEYSEDRSKSLLEKAREGLTKAIDTFRKINMEIEEKRKSEEARTLDSERYDWQKNARLENVERIYSRELTRARLDSITLLALAIRDMEKIGNPKIKQSSAYVELQAGVYRELIKHQYSLRQYMQASEFLQKYIELDPKFEAESLPHQMLVHCFERLYLSAKKLKDEESAEYYLTKKRKHAILFAEKKYGRNSSEFRRVIELLAKE
ncbi:FcpA-related putative periplasmic flagellar protein [Leptospira perolatii]|uniref:FcpA-related putative periplasmic flagellar protein n=1 Tax=Leptospira perolatii TaxID=2023191 RepID=UPI000F635E2B|nr:hypothetical protein [Leptospira perolatii]